MKTVERITDNLTMKQKTEDLNRQKLIRGSENTWGDS